jgi:hypothetical protein
LITEHRDLITRDPMFGRRLVTSGQHVDTAPRFASYVPYVGQGFSPAIARRVQPEGLLHVVNTSIGVEEG